MAETTLEHVEAKAFQREIDRQRLISTMCLIAGILLVCFSSALGRLQATRYESFGNYRFSPDDAHANAVVIQILGGMVFAAGLGERIIVNIKTRN